jgi:uncharacterized membrane protein YkgB
MDQQIDTRSADDRIATIETVGTGILRYGVAFLLLAIGALKFFEFEAKAIQPLVSNSPFMGWLYGVLSVQGVSNLIGTAEIVTGLLIVTRRISPTLSAIGSGSPSSSSRPRSRSSSRRRAASLPRGPRSDSS